MSSYSEKDILTSPKSCIAQLTVARDSLQAQLQAETGFQGLRQAVLRTVTAMIWYSAHSNALLQDRYGLDVEGRMRSHKALMDVIVRSSGSMLKSDAPHEAATRVLRLVDATVMADQDLFQDLTQGF